MCWCSCIKQNFDIFDIEINISKERTSLSDMVNILSDDLTISETRAPSQDHMVFHYKDKMVMSLSYLYNGPVIVRQCFCIEPGPMISSGIILSKFDGTHLGTISIKGSSPTSIGIPIIKIRWSHAHLNCIMEIYLEIYLERQSLYQMESRVQSLSSVSDNKRTVLAIEICSVMSPLTD